VSSCAAAALIDLGVDPVRLGDFCERILDHITDRAAGV
jgi:hypothetical protein